MSAEKTIKNDAAQMGVQNDMPAEKPVYQVLARKYRPQNFDALIGQQTLVRTLKNAIASGRVAHAFMLTGIRGVGKTTTARIIAKALNYKGADGTSNPTTENTDDCSVAQAIAEGRHPDVIELDAASQTSVDNMRDLLDGVRYAPVEARYKIYIIDEVHMLSTSAFNALLKTLEEPPEHVKFIFATTEIRKVPITVLSRCQCFDLRRVDIPTLNAHYKNIAEQENVEISDEALAMISRAADGSVRDGLSLLDQAIALSDESINADNIKNMLGLADKAKGLDLLAHALVGETAESLAVVADLHSAGANPIAVLQDLLDLTHILTRMLTLKDGADMDYTMADAEVERAKQLAEKLTMPSLGKTWQILLKGLGELKVAPNPQSALEMVIMRLVYASNLPDPKDLLERLKKNSSVSGLSGTPNLTHLNTAETQAVVVESAPIVAELKPALIKPEVIPAPAPQQTQTNRALDRTEHVPIHTQAPQPLDIPLNSLHNIVAFLDAHNEILLSSNVRTYVRLVKLEGQSLEITLKDNAPQSLPQDLRAKLCKLTDDVWMVALSSHATHAHLTLAEQEQTRADQERVDVLNMPIVKDVMTAFPDAELVAINKKKTAHS